VRNTGFVLVIFVFILSISTFSGCEDRSTTPKKIDLRLVGTYEYSGPIENIFAHERIIYLITADSGLVLIDASNPVSPVRAGSFIPPSSMSDVVVNGNYAYGSCLSYGMVVLNVSDPYVPNAIGYYRPPADPDYWVVSVAINGDLVYLGCGHEVALDIVDFSDPLAPIFVGRMGGMDIIDQIEISDGIVYARSPGLLENHSILIIDVSDPANPVELSRFRLDNGGCQRIRVQGNYLYFSSYEFPGLTALDMSDPYNPVIFSQYEMPSFVRDVFIEGVGNITRSIAYVADGESGMWILDISEPDNPTVMESFESEGDASLIYREGIYIYLIDSGSGLMIFEFSP
jgi:hypothetical protein